MNTAPRAIVVVTLFFGVTTIAVAARQAAPVAQAPGNAPQMSETFFKDIRVLKGIPIDEFIDTMGMFAAATAKDCTGCHSPQILDGQLGAFAIDTPMIDKARFMIGMMNAINRNYFGGQKRFSLSNESHPSARSDACPGRIDKHWTTPDQTALLGRAGLAICRSA